MGCHCLLQRIEPRSAVSLVWQAASLPLSHLGNLLLPKFTKSNMGLRAKEPHFKLCVFISGCAGSSLLHSLVVESRGYCLAVSGHLAAEASLVRNTSSGALMPPSCTPSLRSCGSWTQLLRGMRGTPRSRMEPMSPALAGRFLSIAPGSPRITF